MKKVLYTSKVFLYFFYFTTASFSQEITPNLKTIVTHSEVIVTGKVYKKESKWNSDKSKIYTEVEIHIDELLKGQDISQNITVKHLGGEVDDVGELYTHMPVFSVEEKVLIFAKRGKDNSAFNVLYGRSGKVELFKEPVTGEYVTANRKKLTKLKKEIKTITQQ